MQTKRTRKCAICRQTFEKKRGMQKIPDDHIDCLVTYGRAESAKKERKEVRQRKEKLKTRSDYIKECQIAFNAYVRNRDYDRPCISCGALLGTGRVGGDADCGHYRSVGSAPHLRFEPTNAHAQCKKCNRYLGGRAVDYRLGLLGRIGLEAVEKLEADQEPRHYSIPDLIALRDEFRLKTKELHKQRSCTT